MYFALTKVSDLATARPAVRRIVPPDDPSDFVGECRCDGGQPKNFLRPCLLLLLAELPAHGYELIERLKVFGFARDPGGLYRTLRSMEREGLVLSRWESSDAGPDRCRYVLTARGGDWLDAWATTLDASRRTLEIFLSRYGSVVAPANPPVRAHDLPTLVIDPRDAATARSRFATRTDRRVTVERH